MPQIRASYPQFRGYPKGSKSRLFLTVLISTDARRRYPKLQHDYVVIDLGYLLLAQEGTMRPLLAYPPRRGLDPETLFPR